VGHLFLVRHAQASFLQQDYDKLSALGETQARLLGEYWARQEVVFDRCCTGPCLRHKHTAKLVSDAYQQLGRKFPVPLVCSEFDEYAAEPVLTQSLPGMIDGDSRIRDLHSAFQVSASSEERFRNFQKLFELVMAEWVSGAIQLEGVETWIEFCSRVNSGLSNFLAAGGRHERLVIFTSGGPIAVAMQRALHLSPQHTLQVSWMSRNCSWTEFLYDPGRFTLSTFNTHAHLEEAALFTYR
jgi:broad specificity phosphatase PhoE